MIDLNGIRVKNRFFIGSGPIKYGRGYEIYENPISFFLFQLNLIKTELFGGVVTKTITLPPWKGNYQWFAPLRVIKKLDDGWANRIGWTNCGIYHFLKYEYPKVKRKANNLILSLGAINDLAEILEMIKMINLIDLLAIELNISCPHVEICFRDDRTKLLELFVRAKEISRHPIIVKLGPEKGILSKALLAEQAGINAISLINTVPAFIPGFGNCGKSGQEIKKIALENIASVSSAVNISIIGGGGIRNYQDCEEFFDARAQAVFFASIFFSSPLKPQRIIKKYAK